MDALGKILILSGDAQADQELGAMLSQSGFVIRRVRWGDTALDDIEAWSPDLVLFDQPPPDREVFQRLHSSEALRDVPVIVIGAAQNLNNRLCDFGTDGIDFVSMAGGELIAHAAARIENFRRLRALEQSVALTRLELAQSESRNRVLFGESPLALIVYDPVTWRVLGVNAACARIMGYTEQHWLTQSLGFAVESGEREALYSLARSLDGDSRRAVHTGRLRFRHSDGHWVETEASVQRFDYPGSREQILIVQDTTELRKMEEHFRRQAKEHLQQLELSVHYDALTGLPNQTLLDERMQQGMAQAQLTSCWMLVCYIDIDAFAEINAAHGPVVGDHLLINAAECLRRCLRGGDTLVRIGSDEFALLALGMRSDDQVEHFLLDLQARLAEPFISDTARLTLSASIGVTSYPHDNADSATLLRHALQAMIVAKQSGAGKCSQFDPDTDRRVRARRETHDNVRAALTSGQFVLHYQPKVNLKSLQVVGAEALIRWQHPVQGLLPPGAFLPAIDDEALTIDLGYWVIGEALTQMDRWRAMGLDLAVSVNIAAQHLLEPRFIERLRELLAEHPDTRAGSLEIEVLETSALQDIARVEQIIVACRELAVGFSLDDFGTGYSSLTYLRRLSADTLKIDQSFINNMMVDTGDKAIVSAVIGLAAAFGRQVIAEGVETLAHARSLLVLGCALAQGYGIARPLAAGSLPDWFAAWPDEAWTNFGNEMAEQEAALFLGKSGSPA